MEDLLDELFILQMEVGLTKTQQERVTEIKGILTKNGIDIPSMDL